MIRMITAEELQQEIENGIITVVNVLAQEYFNDCHIEGSINIPLDQLEEQLKEWDEEQNIVLYCARDECSASDTAAEMLIKRGFTNVRVFKGGIKEWNQKGYACQGACKKSYLH